MTINIKQNPWEVAVFPIGFSFILTLASCFAQFNVAHLIVANFISLGVIAYLYGVYSQ